MSQIHILHKWSDMEGRPESRIELNCSKRHYLVQEVFLQNCLFFDAVPFFYEILVCLVLFWVLNEFKLT